jgi:DNA-binding response OmpR family regulator
VGAQSETRVLVVEDDAAIRQGVVGALRFAGHSVTEAAGAAGVLEEVRRRAPDLVLLDVMLPDGDGFELLSAIRGAAPRLPVILLTARGDEDDRVRGLHLGADDYVVKPFSARELLARVEAVLRRSVGRPLPVRRLRAAGRVVDLERRELTQGDGRLVELSEREAELLRYLAAHRGRAVPRVELLSQLWGCDAQGLTSRSVDMAVARLREKLEEDPTQPALVRTVRGVGYALESAVEVSA